jgi:hypothetical protein
MLPTRIEPVSVDEKTAGLRVLVGEATCDDDTRLQADSAAKQTRSSLDAASIFMI